MEFQLSYFISGCLYLLCLTVFNSSVSGTGDFSVISVEDFDKIDVRVGTVVDACINKKAKKPAYKVKIDFGDEIGIRTSSAQITALYSPENLVGRQVICCVNLSPIHIGDVRSDVRILGTDSEQGVVLLMPAEPVRNGDKVF